ncbi:Ribosomal RNA small subunit methyltransferase D [bioreactor metagenome]|uniref:Ribosomal RNA small subunit methyltransferase D n=1 Tax=bioreactor metagenome TaxID=1076179 RepID=A0A645EKH3_9ZZZZ
MRVIAGSAKGRRLKTTKGQNTRPTLDKVKSAIFNIIQFELEGKIVLDLFCGSGALGLEALSRGAGRCTFVDSDREALDMARENAQFCGLLDQSGFINKPFDWFVKNYQGPSFDIILLDPPYKKGYISNAVSLLQSCGLISGHAIIICESECSETMPGQFGDIGLYREYVYGHTKVSVYKKDV